MFARAPFPYRFHTRRGRSRRRHGKPETNRNIPSAFFGLVVTGLYAITMAEPNWFELDGGICSGRHIGLYTIFGMNIRLIKGKCITDGVILKLRLCASFALLGVISSMFQFALDVCGSNRTGLKCLRRNSIGNILSVLYSVVILGLSYWITLDISQLELKTYTGEIIPISCKFAVAFYLVIGAGLAALIATTFSLMEITFERRRRQHRDRRILNGSDMQLELICDGTEESSMTVFDDLPPVAPPMYQE